MNIRTLITLAIAIIGALATIGLAHAAGLADFDIDPRFRAKIAKAKAKQDAVRTTSLDFRNEEDQASCGSQSIGNVNTSGRSGTAPREVFVFAPNAINIVSGKGCR